MAASSRAGRPPLALLVLLEAAAPPTLSFGAGVFLFSLRRRGDSASAFLGFAFAFPFALGLGFDLGLGCAWGSGWCSGSCPAFLRERLTAGAGGGSMLVGLRVCWKGE